MKILHVDSSILGDYSVSRQVSAAAVARLRRESPGADITYRDLAAQPLPHLTGSHLAAQQAPVSDVEPGVAHDLTESEKALSEFLEADVVVIGSPMYNFTISSQLKAWIDRLAVAGRTFRYTEAGPEGLAAGKRVLVAASRGGFYGPGTPAAAVEHQESYLRAIFGLFGIADVEFIRAEGIAIGPEAREQAITGALSQAGGAQPAAEAA